MAIFHFKHIHLNWRVIPCKRRNDLCFCNFSSFSQHFFFTWLSWFSSRLNLNFSSAWHYMTINFSFFFASFFSFSWSVYFGRIIDGLPTWSTSSYVRIVLRGLVFLVQSCLGHFCLRKDHGSKVFQRNGCLLVNMFQDINLGDFRVSRFWDLYFWLLKGFGRFKAVASLDAYQITNC